LREDGLYGRALSRLIAQALAKQDITVYGDGKQKRSFCYISDTITGLLLLATNPKAKGEVVNVGNTQEITIQELAQKIKDITQSESTITFHPLPKDDPQRRCPDTTKLEKIVGWKPKIELPEGLQKTITWFTK
jgi:nucleoside-diphosphate-sugar epimerase